MSPRSPRPYAPGSCSMSVLLPCRSWAGVWFSRRSPWRARRAPRPSLRRLPLTRRVLQRSRALLVRASSSFGVFGNHLADGVDSDPPRARLAPHGTHVPQRLRLAERPDGDSAGVAISPAAGQLRKQRDPRSGRDHLPQSLETGGAEILLLLRTDAAAHFQRLVTQAVAVLEQQ